MTAKEQRQFLLERVVPYLLCGSALILVTITALAASGRSAGSLEYGCLFVGALLLVISTFETVSFFLVADDTCVNEGEFDDDDE